MIDMADLANITDRYNESDKAGQNPAFLPKPSRRAEQDSLMRADVLMICKYFPPVSGGMEEYVGRLADTVEKPATSPYSHTRSALPAQRKTGGVSG